MRRVNNLKLTKLKSRSETIWEKCALTSTWSNEYISIHSLCISVLCLRHWISELPKKQNMRILWLFIKESKYLLQKIKHHKNIEYGVYLERLETPINYVFTGFTQNVSKYNFVRTAKTFMLDYTHTWTCIALKKRSTAHRYTKKRYLKCKDNFIQIFRRDKVSAGSGI